MTRLRTEFPFVLPKGLPGVDGELHRVGTMRLATARDELEPLRDPSVEDADDPRLTLLVLARVVTSLGTHGTVTADELTELYAADLAYLQDVYRIINYGSTDELDALLDVTHGRVDAATPAPLALQPDVPVPAVAPPSLAASEPTPTPAPPRPASDVAEAATDPAAPAAPDTPPEATSRRASPTPVSDAARSLLRTPEPDPRVTSADVGPVTGQPNGAPTTAPTAAGDDRDGDADVPTPQPAPAPSGGRRGRIEEVGRSTGRPGGV